MRPDWAASWAVFGLAALPGSAALRITCVFTFAGLLSLGQTFMAPTLGPLVNRPPKPSPPDHRPAGKARILGPMAELVVDEADLVVHLTLGEKIGSFHGDIRVGLSAMVSVAPDPKPWLSLRGWRMAGVSFAGHAVLGTRRHGAGYDFCILHGDRPAVRVDLASGRFSRLIICMPEGGDPEAEAIRIAAAAGITPSAPVSWPVR